MRLGLVGPLPPPPGGMANQTRQLAQLLRSEGVDVAIVRTNEPYRPRWLRRIRGARAVWRLLPYLLRIERLARRSDVIHVMANSGWAWFLFAAPALRIARWHRVPVIVNYRGGLAREFLRRRIARGLPRALRNAQEVVVPTPFLQEVFGRYGVRSRIIPNIVDLDVFQPAAELPQGAPHIVVTRNLEHIYGIDVAIRAVALLAREIPGLRLSVAGSGPERLALERLAAQMGIAHLIRFTGSLEQNTIAALYRAAHVSLNPSRADNAPNALLEAAACGVPIVTTSVGGVPYLVEHGKTAWLVRPDDPQAMAEGIAHVLRDAGLREALRSNGLALARSCSWATVGRQWTDLYRQLASTGWQTKGAVQSKGC